MPLWTMWHCVFYFFISLGLYTESVHAESLEETIDSFYRTEPSRVIDALNQVDKQAYSRLKPALLVKASYAAATTTNVDLAITLTDILLKKAYVLEDDLLFGKAYYNRGAAYAYTGQHALALDSLLFALASFENTDSAQDIARIKGALALIYVEIGEFDLAKPYFQESLDSHRERNDQTNMAIVLQNRAFMHILTGKNEQAKSDLLESLSLSKEMGLKSNYPVIYKNLGKVATAQGRFEQAFNYFEQAITSAQNNHLPHHVSEILQERALLLIKINSFEQARENLKESIKIAQQFSLLKQLRGGYLLLADVSAKLENYKEAYESHEKAAQVSEQMGESRIAANLSRLDRYTTQLKEQNKRLVLEKEKQIATLATERQVLFRNFSIFIAIIAVVFLIYFIRRFTYSNKRAELFEQQSKVDVLTGVWNRRAGEAQLVRLCNRDKESLNVFSIAMLDIDFFKRVNDCFGHDAGDRVIIALCKMIEENLRPTDMLCRWGGEEFIIILDDAESAIAFEICERIRSKLELTEIGGVGHLTVSIGIAMFENDDLQELIKRGDSALYFAKEQGRNRVVIKRKSSHEFDMPAIPKEQDSQTK